MTVFKLYWKLFLKNIWIILGYTVIFLAVILITMSSSPADMTNFEVETTDVVFIDHDKSEVSKGLEKYLDDYVEYIEIDDDKLEEAFFYRRVEVIITIPEGFGAAFTSDTPLQIEKRTIPNEVNGYFIEGKINSYLSVAYTYLNNNLVPEADLVDAIIANLAKEADVTVKSEETVDLSYILVYFNFLAYILTALIVTVSSQVMSSFQDFDLRRRNSVGAISDAKVNLNLIAGSVTTSIILLLFYYIVAWILYPTQIFTAQGLFMMLNTFVYMLVMVAFGYFLTIAFRNKVLVSGIGTALSLGFAFLSGAFLPQSWLSSGVQAASKIFPMWFHVRNNEIMALTSPLMGEFWLNIGVMAIFFIIFVGGSMLITRLRTTRES